MIETAEVVIIGSGAAGLMAAIWAGRTNPHRRILILDSAQKLGAKILVSGGGRCNVTHHHIDDTAYAGSSRPAIRKVLRRFDVEPTIRFFADLGIELKQEDTGKLFPTTDSARTVLDALLRAAREVGVTIQHPRRVESIRKDADTFTISGEWGSIESANVILATGGRSLPKTGSDGHGYALVRNLGHTLTHYIFPALVPLNLPRDHFICELSGITVPTTLTVHANTGKKLVSFTDSTLCTHFGLSGPSVLDISRYYIDALHTDPGASLTINWMPEKTPDQFEADLLAGGRLSVYRYIHDHLPERLARALCDQAGIAPGITANQLTRVQRRLVVQTCTQLPLPITGNRGYTYAEVTAGGVPLSELHLDTMMSRVCPGLQLCGEICDVDGRIGGFNFQWAWSSGYIAGTSVGKA